MNGLRIIPGILLIACLLLVGTAGAATPTITTITPAIGVNTTSVSIPNAGTNFAAVAAQMRSSLSGNLSFTLVTREREKSLNGITHDAMVTLKKQIQASLSEFRYNEQSGAWTAVNYDQHMAFQTTDAGGIRITSDNGTAGMQFAGICRDECTLTTPAGIIHADGTRLEIDRGPATEWYLNSNTGIEQGMTLANSPDGTGNVQVTFDLSGTLTPALEGQTLVFSARNGPVIKYAGLTAHDATGRTLPAIMILTGTRLVWQVDDRNAVYPVTIDPTWSQIKILTASDGTDNALFGNGVAISNDTAIVGAYQAAGGGTQRGEAYIFQKDKGGTNNWGQVKILTASDGTDNAQFGWSVAISNDTAIVGAVVAPGGGTKRGEAYIYQKDKDGTNNWGQVKVLTASDGTDNALFGISVAISNDTAIVGANNAPGGGTNRGEAYIYQKDKDGTNNWGQVKVLTASDAVDFADLGTSVAISNDTAIVGAHTAPGGGTQRGEAYIFQKDKDGTNNWGEVKVLTASDGADNAQFGYSVGISNDTAIVSANQAAGGGTQRGEAYTFRKDKDGTNNWGEVKILTASDGADNAQFGWLVAISNDTAIVGAYQAAGGGSQRGQAYTFRKDTGGTNNWGQEQILSASDGADNAGFGWFVAISNDTAIVGAYQAAGGGIKRGEAYIFVIPPTVTGISPTSGTTAGGTSVTVTGTGFNGATSVKFGATSAASYTVNSATQITAISPAGAAGTVDITVTTGGGTSVTGAADQFTFTVTPTPTPTPAPVNYGGDGDMPPSAPVAQSTSSAQVPLSTIPVNVGQIGTTPITGVMVTGTGIRDIIVTATEESGPGTGMPVPPGAVYTYVDISPARFTTITEALISFVVPQLWLDEHHLAPQDIVLYHSAGTGWQALPTTQVRTANGQFYYTATSPGFSRFAITGQAGLLGNTSVRNQVTTLGITVPAVSPQPAVTTLPAGSVPVTTQTTAVPVPEPVPGFLFKTLCIIGTGVVVLGGFVLLFRRWWIRRQNPALFRKYD